MTNDRVFISDCTLRDFRNAPGVFFTDAEAAQVATLLSSLGINEIEAGIVNNAKPTELDFIEKIANLELEAHTSAIFFAFKSKEIDAAVSATIDSGCKALTITLGVSPAFLERKLGRSFRAACKLMERSVEKAASMGLSVVCGGEDSGHADVEQLCEYARIAELSGADRFRFAESVSCLSPRDTTAVIEKLCNTVSIPVEAHCHSAFGLGTANAIAALEAGARGVSATVEGFGERGGNTSLNTVLMYLWQFRNHRHLNLKNLKPVSDLVARVTEMPLHRFNPITGDSAFEYEIGNQFFNADMYDAFDPSVVGNSRRLTLGLKGDPIGLKTLIGTNNDVVGRARQHAAEYVKTHRVSYAP